METYHFVQIWGETCKKYNHIIISIIKFIGYWTKLGIYLIVILVGLLKEDGYRIFAVEFSIVITWTIIWECICGLP